MEVITLTKEAFDLIIARLDQLERRYDKEPEALAEDHLFTSEQARDILKVSESTLQRHRNNGRLDYYNLGRSVRYSRKGIRAFVDRFQPGRKVAC